MDPKLQKIIESLKNINLKEDEKFNVRQNLLNLSSRDNINNSAKISVWSWFAYHRVQAVSIFTLLLIVFGGSLSAQNALPGDILYPLKVNVNENVLRTISKTSPISEVNFEASIMEKRLLEAEKLDNQNKLNGSIKSAVSSGVAKEAAKVNSAVNNLIDKNAGSLKTTISNKNISTKKEVPPEESTSTSAAFSVSSAPSQINNVEKNSASTSTSTAKNKKMLDNASSKPVTSSDKNDDALNSVNDRINYINNIIKNHRKIIEKIESDDKKSPESDKINEDN